MDARARKPRVADGKSGVAMDSRRREKMEIEMPDKDL